MGGKHVAFERLHDIRAVRVIVRNVRECYTVLGVVHDLWKPIEGEFDDYIANPKANEYRSLHTAVIGPEGLTLEVQIRTEEMHQLSEHGVAAHWRATRKATRGPGQGVRREDRVASPGARVEASRCWAMARGVRPRHWRGVRGQRSTSSRPRAA